VRSRISKLESSTRREHEKLVKFISVKFRHPKEKARLAKLEEEKEAGGGNLS